MAWLYLLSVMTISKTTLHWYKSVRISFTRRLSFSRSASWSSMSARRDGSRKIGAGKTTRACTHPRQGECRRTCGKDQRPSSSIHASPLSPIWFMSNNPPAGE
ncbi:hypothetical protein IEO21_03007 [Rhodonia placenta]|uniref:Uncharacterized protein n=1 Tax=Rhodonia placenta TaxID=104341 RepID=A0A8H7P6W8_9APHY|nr:hypothetical protein IEO21_03007 [Postia placenta]